MTAALVPLETLGKGIVARIEKGQKYKDKADEMFVSAGKMLVELRDRVNKQKLKGGLKAAIEKYCKGLSRSRAYEILAIADGTKTIAQVRDEKATRERNRHTVSAMADTKKGETGNAVVNPVEEHDEEQEESVEEQEESVEEHDEEQEELGEATGVDYEAEREAARAALPEPLDFISKVGVTAAEAFARAVLRALGNEAAPPKEPRAESAADSAKLGADAAVAEDTPEAEDVPAPKRKAIERGQPLVWEDYAPVKEDGGKCRGLTEPMPGKLHYFIEPQWDAEGKKAIGHEVTRRTFNGAIKAEAIIASGDISYAEARARAQADFDLSIPEFMRRKPVTS